MRTGRRPDGRLVDKYETRPVALSGRLVTSRALVLLSWQVQSAEGRCSTLYLIRPTGIMSPMRALAREHDVRVCRLSWWRFPTGSPVGCWCVTQHCVAAACRSHARQLSWTCTAQVIGSCSYSCDRADDSSESVCRHSTKRRHLLDLVHRFRILHFNGHCAELLRAGIVSQSQSQVAS